MAVTEWAVADLRPRCDSPLGAGGIWGGGSRILALRAFAAGLPVVGGALFTWSMRVGKRRASSRRVAQPGAYHAGSSRPWWRKSRTLRV